MFYSFFLYNPNLTTSFAKEIHSVKRKSYCLRYKNVVLTFTSVTLTTIFKVFYKLPLCFQMVHAVNLRKKGSFEVVRHLRIIFYNQFKKKKKNL